MSLDNLKLYLEETIVQAYFADMVRLSSLQAISDPNEETKLELASTLKSIEEFQFTSVLSEIIYYLSAIYNLGYSAIIYQDIDLIKLFKIEDLTN